MRPSFSFSPLLSRIGPRGPERERESKARGPEERKRAHQGQGRTWESGGVAAAPPPANSSSNRRNSMGWRSLPSAAHGGPLKAERTQTRGEGLRDGAPPKPPYGKTRSGSLPKPGRRPGRAMRASSKNKSHLQPVCTECDRAKIRPEPSARHLKSCARSQAKQQSTGLRGLVSPGPGMPQTKKLTQGQRWQPRLSRRESLRRGQELAAR